MIALATLAACTSGPKIHNWTDDAVAPRLEAKPPLVIGHRGASGYLPEHTLEAYELAIRMGADFIEPDLVSTKDGVLVARHENEIGGTTDVAKKFPNRKTKKKIDGVEMEGWFTEDFTYAELSRLRTKERLATRGHVNDGKFRIPTFEQVIQLALRKTKETGRTIGVYPETKHPSYFKSIGLPLEDKLVALLDKYGLSKKESPVFIQSFEVGNLRELSGKTQVRLVQLFDEATAQPYDFVLSKDPRTYGDLCKPDQLRLIADYADGIGPWKRLIVGETKDGKLLPANSLIHDAHAAGLVVHPYTFRSDPNFLAADYESNPEKEYLHFYRLGVDGVFSDFSDHAVSARAKFLTEEQIPKPKPGEEP
jgi:glycerophosphoryl diester phosphodiesterase